MKNRIEKKFQDLKRRNKKAFIAFITAGDPTLEVTYKLVLALEKSGAAIIELGVPFSDPMADGPTIQAASCRALKKGVNLAKILKLVLRIRKSSQVPLALMTYYNLVFRYGEERFIKNCGKSGVDGVIIPDLPPEEARVLIRAGRKNKVSTIFFLAPTSTKERIKLVSRISTGFIYYVSLTGVTGVRRSLPSDIIRNIRFIKRYCTKPVCVGFGISNSEQVKALSHFSDGVIVGSAIVKQVEKNLHNRNLIKNVSSFVKKLTRAL
ncbi:MAG: tryptophan synthase subunit alpha [Candidatus Omnitrophota bacterium]|nr:tryptophan synthase subunit alpha [Candidatus Omnitrophota bacterium]